MGNSWTKAQEEAITARGRDILVAAAAGSGKTAVLVERIIRKVTDQENPQSVDRLLVLTFTRAAAAEMKERVGQALETALAQNPSPYLERQAALLPQAKIMTIDALCLELVRENAPQLDLDPGFRVGDPGEMELLREEVLDAVMEAAYGEEGNAGFLQLVETFGSSKSDRPLRDLVFTVYDFCQSHPFPRAWLHQAVEQCHLRPETPFRETVWGWRLWQETQRILDDMAELLALEETIAPAGYLPTVAADRALFAALTEAFSQGTEAFYEELYTVAFARLGRKKKEDDPADAETCKALREQVKDCVKELREQLYFKPPAEMKAEFAALYPLFAALEQLVNRFEAAFRAAKKERYTEDFHDLEHDALRVLLAPESTEKRPMPSVTARELRERFDEVLCDEYQDSNLVQEFLLRALSRGDNRFMVGDVKQSIYRFRLARPELFLEKYQNFDGRVGQRIDLSQNFRSRANVLACANLIFSRTMDESLGEVTYDEAAALHPGAAFPDLAEPGQEAMEVLVIDGGTAVEEDSPLAELSAAETEAAAVAGRLREMLNPEHPFLVYDRKQEALRPVQCADMVVLLRSPGTWGGVMAQTLNAFGIPAFADGQGAFYDTTEILTMTALLKILDNPRQDIPLLTVLHSPIFGLSSARLLEMKTRGEAEGFYDCLLALAGEEDVAAFLARLEGWRQAADRLTVEELLQKLYRETRYFDYVGATPGGFLRQANLRLLQEMAAQAAAAGVQSLFAFLRYWERLAEKNPQAGGAAALPAGSQVVRILSIHRSKGLEFPVVVVAGLGKKMNRRDTQAPLLLHPEAGLAADVTDVELRLRTRGISKALLARQLAREALSEELRVLYVALTRAREKLILTGSVRYLNSAQKRWALQGEGRLLPRRLRATAGCYFDWVIPALEQGDGKARYAVRYVGRDEVPHPQERPQDGLAAPRWPADLAADHSGRRREIFDRLAFVYPYQKEAALPGSLSVSEIKRLQWAGGGEESEPLFAGSDWAEPAFAREEGAAALSGAQRGTAVHTLLETLDLSRVYTPETLEAAIAERVRAGGLTAEQAQTLPREKLLSFLGSELAGRMRRSPRLLREQPFTLLLRPEEVYGRDYAGVAGEILLRGIIDCCFEEDGRLVLVDYKTDRSRPEEIARRYAVQMDLYQKALEAITGEPVAERWLYLFHWDRPLRV